MLKPIINLLNNLRIGQRLTLGFGILVTLILLVGVVEFTLARVQGAALDNRQAAEDEVAESVNISLQLAEARQNEEDFLLRWRREGFENAYNSYYLRNQEHIQNIQDIIVTIRQEGHAHSLAELTQIELAISTYDSVFTSVVLGYQRRGFVDTGLEGEFRTAVRALEASPVFQSNQDLLVTLLQLRRHEKDYLLRGEQEYIDSTRTTNAELQNQLSALNLPDEAKAELIGLAATYLAKFDELVVLEAEIATQTEEYQAAIQAIRDIPQALIADAEAEKSEAIENFNATEQFARIVDIGAVGLAVALGIGLAVAIRTSITEPLNELASAAKKLGQGELSQRAQVTTRDEAGALGQAFNEMAERIQETQNRVNARTQDLATTIEVGRLATSIFSQEELLPRLVEFIRSRFALYYTQVYLVDEALRYATLYAATGETGKQLLARSHRLDLGQTSLVGSAVQTRQSVLVTDTETSTIHKKNPLLPDTRSELAIPLVVADTILGVLDMQAEKSGTFNQENLAVFEAMASQIASVMQGAKAYDAAQAASETAESIIRRITGDQWTPYLGQLAQGKRIGYQYDLETPTSLDVEDLFKTGERVLHQAVVVRGQQIGSIMLEDETKQEWTPEERALVEDVAQRVALALEQYRAFDETRTTLESLDRIYTMSVDLIGSSNFAGYFVKLNPAWEKVLGHTIDELMAVPFASFVHPDDAAHTNAEAAKIAEGATAISFENRYRCKDGSYKWISWNASSDTENEQIHFIARDITQQKDAETARQRLVGILEGTPDFVAMADPEGNLTYINPAGRAMMGIPFDEDVRNSRIPDYYPKHAVKEILNKALPIAARDGVWSGETVFLSRDGREIPVLEVIMSQKGADGEIESFSTIVRDITDRKLQEEERQILYQVARKLTDARTPDELLDAVVEYSKQRNLDTATLMYIDTTGDNNPEWAQITAQWNMEGSLPMATEVGARFYLPQFPFSRFWIGNPEGPTFVDDIATTDAVDEATRAILAQSSIRGICLLPLYRLGHWVGLISLSSREPYHFTEQDERILTSIANQATSQAEALRAAEVTQKRASELETVAMVSAATTSILNIGELLQSVVDLTRDSFELYHAQIYLMDETRENLVLAAGAGEAGEQMKAQGHRIPVDREHSLVARAARSREPVVSNDVTSDPDFLANPLLPDTKSEVAVSMIIAGEVIGVLDVQADSVSRFKDEDLRIQTTLADQIAVAVQNARAFAETEARAERLREVDRLKSQFLANMSHELRTPLNSIIGYSEVLLDGVDGDLTEDAAEDVQAIHDSGKHLLSIINEILDLAKIEAGQMQLERKPVKLSDFVQEIVKAGQILVKDKSVVLNWMEDSPREMEVMADAIRLRQIMWNLVSNAVKFTEDGSVTVAYGMRNDAEVYVKVTDTGIGLSQEGLSIIFQRFRQADGSSTRRAGGTGLGLTITRELIQMHGGDIHVESEVGVGSTFWFTLPVKRTEPIES